MADRNSIRREKYPFYNARKYVCYKNNKRKYYYSNREDPRFRTTYMNPIFSIILSLILLIIGGSLCILGCISHEPFFIAFSVPWIVICLMNMGSFIRNKISQAKDYRCPDAPIEVNCSHCGGVYVRDTHTNCPHCGMPIIGEHINPELLRKDYVEPAIGNTISSLGIIVGFIIVGAIVVKNSAADSFLDFIKSEIADWGVPASFIYVLMFVFGFVVIVFLVGMLKPIYLEYFLKNKSETVVGTISKIETEPLYIFLYVDFPDETYIRYRKFQRKKEEFKEGQSVTFRKFDIYYLLVNDWQ